MLVEFGEMEGEERDYLCRLRSLACYVRKRGWWRRDVGPLGIRRVSFDDILRKRLDQSLVDRPFIDHTPQNRSIRAICSLSDIVSTPALSFQLVPPLPQIIQTAPSRRARLLRVLRKLHRPSPITITKPILRQPPIHLLRQRIRLPKRSIGPMRRRLGTNLV